MSIKQIENIFTFKNKQLLKAVTLTWTKKTVLLFCCYCKQDVNTTRYHVVASERLLKTDLQPGGYKQTLLGFSFQLGIFPRDGKVWIQNIYQQLSISSWWEQTSSNHMTLWTLSCSCLWTMLRSTLSTSWVVKELSTLCRLSCRSTETAAMTPNTTKSWWGHQVPAATYRSIPDQLSLIDYYCLFFSKGNLRGLFVPTKQNLPKWHHPRRKFSDFQNITVT